MIADQAGADALKLCKAKQKLGFRLKQDRILDFMTNLIYLILVDLISARIF